MSNDIKFYMQRIDVPGQKIYDLEKDFKGLKYSRAKGMESIGESRIYEESFAETESIDVFIPEKIVNKNTKIDLLLYFTGKEMYNTYEDFNKYICEGIHKFWDTKRNKEVEFYVKDKIEPSEVMWYGSTPYIEVTYKLNNINGKTKKHI